MEITKKLSESLYNIKNLTNEDTEQLKTLIIDYFAATYAGYKINSAFNIPIEKIVLGQAGKEESFVFMQKEKSPVGKAAFMNAVYGHGAELDDGNKTAAGHAGVHLIPAVFALADKLGSTYSEVLIALAIGYEAYIRISSAAMPGMVRHGFHSTGMTGTLACAAACAKLYGLDAQGIEDAIALATTLSGGLLSYGDSRPAIKPLNPGKAAENGVFAAMLAKEGVKGPTEALEGPNGWFHAVTDEIKDSYLDGSDHLLLHDCYFKLYPSCRHTHCGIDAGCILHNKTDIKTIKEIKVYIYPNAIKLAGIKYPKNQDETKFSIYYTLACSLINGSYGIADMNVSNISEEIISVIEKISLIPDENMENREKGIRGAKVELINNDGKIISETVFVPKGDPENPLERKDVINKLKTCAKGQANDDVLIQIVNVITESDIETKFINPMKYIRGNP